MILFAFVTGFLPSFLFFFGLTSKK